MLKFFILILYLSINLYAEMIIGIPGGYKKIFPKIIKIYNQKYKTNIKAIYGPLGLLIAQAKLKNVDMILIEKRKIKNNTFNNFTPFFRGTMTIISSKKITSLKSLKKIKLLAVPNPSNTTYGFSASEMFKHLSFKIPILYVSMMPQGINYLQIGNVDAAIANLVQAKRLSNFNYYIVPQKYYTPIILGFVKIKNFKNDNKFLKFLKTKQIINYLENKGMKYL